MNEFGRRFFPENWGRHTLLLYRNSGFGKTLVRDLSADASLGDCSVLALYPLSSRKLAWKFAGWAVCYLSCYAFIRNVQFCSKRPTDCLCYLVMRFFEVSVLFKTDELKYLRTSYLVYDTGGFLGRDGRSGSDARESDDHSRGLRRRLTCMHSPSSTAERTSGTTRQRPCRLIGLW